jgi:hypothetical protein
MKMGAKDNSPVDVELGVNNGQSSTTAKFKYDPLTPAAEPFTPHDRIAFIPIRTLTLIILKKVKD